MSILPFDIYLRVAFLSPRSWAAMLALPIFARWVRIRQTAGLYFESFLFFEHYEKIRGIKFRFFRGSLQSIRSLPSCEIELTLRLDQFGGTHSCPNVKPGDKDDPQCKLYLCCFKHTAMWDEKKNLPAVEVDSACECKIKIWAKMWHHRGTLSRERKNPAANFLCHQHLCVRCRGKRPPFLGTDTKIHCEGGKNIFVRMLRVE